MNIILDPYNGYSFNHINYQFGSDFDDEKKETVSKPEIDNTNGELIESYSGRRLLLPVLLPEFEEPKILTCSLESTVAEKLDAIISLMETTSRMKDFFDIYYMATTLWSA